MLMFCDSIICNRISKKYIFKLLKANNKSVFNVSPIRTDIPARKLPALLLFCLMIALSLSPPAASSSLNLTAPLFMDVSGQEAFEIQFESTDDVGGLSAGISLPDSLHYTGNTRMVIGGKERHIDPSLVEGWLRWDLTDALRSLRHV